MSANDKQVGGDHYRAAIQHWDYVVANKMPYLEAMAFKYIDRHARKNGKQDLEKAMHFIEKMIETYYPEPLELTDLTAPFLPEALEKEVLPPSLIANEVCPNASNGKHSWEHTYKHGKDGRLQEVKVCLLCKGVL